MIANIIGITGTLCGTIGIFFGFYFITSNNAVLALKTVTITTVGIVGVLAFIRHVIFHKSDAKRMGWETDRPDWMFEVGFANLAFGIAGFVAVFPDRGMVVQAVVILGYALYLFQAGILHGYRFFTSENRSVGRLVRFSLSTILYAIMMSYFALNALV